MLDYGKRTAEIRAAFKAGLEEVRELPDGYALRFPGTDEWLRRLAEFVAAERRCCPFFAFTLQFEPDHGPIWLSLRGPEGVKEIVASEFLPSPTGTST